MMVKWHPSIRTGATGLWSGNGRTWRVACEPTTDKEIRPIEADGLGSDAPVRLIQWGGTLPSRRRFVQGLSFATFVALGGNFAGVSSLLLSLDGGHLTEETKLDVLVPVMNYKRCWNPDMGFEFRYPARWLADQRLARRAAERIEQENPLDLPSPKFRRPMSYSLDPDAAFGPAGGRGEENISVIVTDVAEGFELAALGTPEEAALKLLQERIAPKGSNKTATLIQATRRMDPMGTPYYSMEYTVQSASWFRHNIAVFAVRTRKLYTFNAQCPEAQWDEWREVFNMAADSFHVFPRPAALQF